MTLFHRNTQPQQTPPELQSWPINRPQGEVATFVGRTVLPEVVARVIEDAGADRSIHRRQEIVANLIELHKDRLSWPRPDEEERFEATAATLATGYLGHVLSQIGAFEQGLTPRVELIVPYTTRHYSDSPVVGDTEELMLKHSFDIVKAALMSDQLGYEVRQSQGFIMNSQADVLLGFMPTNYLKLDVPILLWGNPFL